MKFMPALSPTRLLQLRAKSFHPFTGNSKHLLPLGSYFNFQLVFLKISLEFTISLISSQPFLKDIQYNLSLFLHSFYDQ
jgi:hypothetical protein